MTNPVLPETDHHIVVSADAHCGASVRDYKHYLEARYHDDFDAWADDIEAGVARQKALYKDMERSPLEVGVDGDPGVGAEQDLKLEHFALSATGRSSFEERLVAAGEKFQTVDLNDVGITQYNIWDPDGNHIHIDFREG